MILLNESDSKRDNADDFYRAVAFCGMLSYITLRRTRWWCAGVSWEYPNEARAGARGLFRPLVLASQPILMTYISAALLVDNAMTARALNKARGALPSRVQVGLPLSPGATLLSQDLSNSEVSFGTPNVSEALTLQRTPTYTSGNLLPPSRLRLATGSAGSIPAGVTNRPPTVPLSQQSGEATEPSQEESVPSSMVAAEERLTVLSDEADFGQPRGDQWVCRISVGWGSCGWREDSGRHWRMCPEGYCCSKTACSHGKCGGGWCVEYGSPLCWIQDFAHKGGACSCQSHGSSCSGNAVCHTFQHPDGGAYCTCAEHFLGNGKNCASNPCRSDPCAPGSCSPRGDSYVCDCPTNTHDLVETNPQECVAKKNPCMSDPCGPPAVVESCLNFEVDYECICKDGYVSEAGICEKVDWCKNDPCGPPAAVHDCVSVGVGFKCYCQRGYVRQTDDEGLEYCEKDFCAENPCGSPEYVDSCTNRRRRSTYTDTDEDSEAGPRYSCLCSDLAELKVDPQTQEGKCVRADPCKGDPCGPPEAVAKCFVQGLSYGCSCKAGYTAKPAGENKGEKCVAGDPCTLKACGSDEFVERCTTDGKTYSCHCSKAGFLSHEASGTQVCRSRKLCEENCGPTEAVKRCTPHTDTYECVCVQGYLLAYNNGKRSCVAGDVCAVHPCGSSKAVAECRREEYGYSCICNRGYELRRRPDETLLCAEPQSCVGDPCGPDAAVQLCLPGKYAYACKCREPYVPKDVQGRQRCVMPLNESRERAITFSSKEEETESPEQPGGLLAGAAVGGVVVVVMIGISMTYAKKQGGGEKPESWEREGNVFPDRPPGMGVQGSETRAVADAALLQGPSAW